MKGWRGLARKVGGSPTPPLSRRARASKEATGPLRRPKPTEPPPTARPSSPQRFKVLANKRVPETVRPVEKSKVGRTNKVLDVRMVGRHRVDADPLLGTVQAGARRRGHRCRVRLEGDGRERGRKRAGRKRGGAEPREGEGKRVSVVVRESEMKSASSRRKYGGVGGARRAGGRRVQEKENNSPSPSQRRHPDHGRARRSYTTPDAPRAHQVNHHYVQGHGIDRQKHRVHASPLYCRFGACRQLARRRPRPLPLALPRRRSQRRQLDLRDDASCRALTPRLEGVRSSHICHRADYSASDWMKRYADKASSSLMGLTRPSKEERLSLESDLCASRSSPSRSPCRSTTISLKVDSRRENAMY